VFGNGLASNTTPLVDDSYSLRWQIRNSSWRAVVTVVNTKLALTGDTAATLSNIQHDHKLLVHLHQPAPQGHTLLLQLHCKALASGLHHTTQTDSIHNKTKPWLWHRETSLPV
jgi:hypothetical protein